MGTAWRAAVNSRLLKRSLRLFLPLSAAVSLVLLPMVALYEQSHRETLEARGFALAQAGSVRVQTTLRELRSNTGVITTLPVVSDVLAAGSSASPLVRQRLDTMLRAQLREYERLRALAVIDRQGQVLSQLGRPPGPIDAASLQVALKQGAALGNHQLWMSPVQWPVGAAGTATPELLTVRPLFSPAGERRGVLLAVVSLGPLARDFNLITNSRPALQQGTLLSGEGRAINAPPGAAVGMNFAARHPHVWRRMQLEASGVVMSPQGLFVFDSGRSQQHLGIVIQVPPRSLAAGSLFSQPVGRALVGLLYLLLGAVSAGVALYQQNLAGLREQEWRLQERLQTVLHSAGVGMCLCDPLTGRFLSVNQALCRFFERSETELLACTWQQLTHPEDLAADQRQAEKLHQGELNSYHMRKRFLRPDGSSIWGDLVVACSRNADGTVRDLIGQISDVSELVAKTDYLEAAASAGVVGVWDWDVRRDVLTWDGVMVRLYGLRAEAFQGTRQAWEKAVHPDDKPFVLQELEAALRGWRDYQPRFRVVWPDGSIHVLQARSRTTYAADGSPLRMIGVNYDITDQVAREQQLEQQRQLLAATQAALVDPLLTLSLDPPPGRGNGQPALRIAELNPAAAAFFCRSQPQLLGQPLSEALPATLNPALQASLLAVAQGGPALLADAQPVRLREGAEPLYLDVRAVAASSGLVVSFRDVSAQRRAIDDLAASEERFRLLAENASDVVFRANLAGETEWITASVTPLLGWEPADLLHKPFAPFVHPDDLDLLREVDAAFARGERRQFRLRVLQRQGDHRWVSVNARGLRGDDGAVVGIVGSWRDAHAEVEAEAELDRRARLDPLTGLLNRQEIFERLDRLARHRRQHDAAPAVLFCDIDHFKEINDRHGHAGGDTVLQTLAQRLRRRTRHEDLVGRIGGDELLVVLQGMPSLETALAFAAKLHSAASAPLPLASGELRPTLSIGVTLINTDEPIEAVVARADQAMYEAKKAGRNRVVAFS